MTNSRSSFIMGIRAGILVLSLGLCSGHAQDSSYPDEQDNPGAYAYVQGDYTGAANIWLVEAYEGSAEAQFNLGVLYLSLSHCCQILIVLHAISFWSAPLLWDLHLHIYKTVCVSIDL